MRERRESVWNEESALEREARECVERGERSLASARSLAHLRADGRLSAGALVDGDVASVEVLRSFAY